MRGSGLCFPSKLYCKSPSMLVREWNMLLRQKTFIKLDEKTKFPHATGKILYWLTLQSCLNYGKKTGQAFQRYLKQFWNVVYLWPVSLCRTVISRIGRDLKRSASPPLCPRERSAIFTPYLQCKLIIYNGIMLFSIFLLYFFPSNSQYYFNFL